MVIDVETWPTIIPTSVSKTPTPTQISNPTAYHHAFSDWCYPPVIHEVSNRLGCIPIDASDTVQVTKVRVTILDDAGNILEQGEAARVFGV